MSSRLLRLAVIGTVAGAFSGLFGVGGGSVVVPLLVLWMAYDERTATGTSLTAIIVIATAAAGVQALHGHVDPGKAAIVGLPALVGVVAGTALQQRVSAQYIAGAFAALLLVSAALLVF
jgi:uncharacterized membrane protein YfcA